MLSAENPCRRLAVTLQILFLVSYCRYTRAHLNLYITRKHLKDNFNLDFGNDVYLVTDGVPASLLQNPSTFRDFVAPLASSVRQVQFRWRSYPLGDDIKIIYSIDTSSSDIDIMDTPILSISPSGSVPWYDSPENGFIVEFPCSGKKDGFVDVGFSLNYTSYGTGQKEHLRLLLRRHCVKTIDDGGNSTYSGANAKGAAPSLSRSLVIGLSALAAVLVCIVGYCLIYCMLRRRNKKLQMKFDYDYELKKTYDHESMERSPMKRSYSPCKENNMLDFGENEELLQDELHSPSKPVYIPKKKTTQRKWRRSRRHRNCPLPVEGTPPPAYSPISSSAVPSGPYCRPLENIPEEEVVAVEDLSYSHAADKSSFTELPLEQTPPNCSSSISSSCPQRFGGASSCSVDRDFVAVTLPETMSSNSISEACSRQKRPQELLFKNRRHVNTLVTHESEGRRSNSKCEPLVLRGTQIAGAEDNKGYLHSPQLPTASVAESSVIENIPVIRTFTAGASNKPCIAAHNTEELFRVLNDSWREQFKDCLLQPHQIIVDNSHYIGKGAFGRVHRGKVKGLPGVDSNRLTTVAVKVMLPSSDVESVSAFVSEALVMRSLRHVNVIELYGVVLQPTAPPLIVTSFMKHGDLNQFLRSGRATPKRPQSLSTRQLVNFGLQIGRGMEYLASACYVHRDLATRNCMVSDDLVIKIADFGLARDLSEEHYRMARKTRLPIKWMAIESLTDFIFSELTDVWSFGVVLWELMTLGKQPYSGVANHDMEAHLSQGHRLHQPQNCPDEIYSIMTSCWHAVPTERPTFTLLCSSLGAFEGKYLRYTLDFNISPTQTPAV